MRELPHAPGYTLSADAFMEPKQLVGFSLAHHPLSVFLHFHEFYEIGLVIRGTGKHITAAGDESLRRGSAIFVAPGVSHGYEMCEDLLVYNAFLRVEAARFDLPWAPRDGVLGRLFMPAGATPRAPVVVTLGEGDLADCLGHLEAIREHLPEIRSEAYDLGHMLLAIDVLARELGRERPDHQAADPRAPAIVTSAIDLIERDLLRHWTLDELSAQLFIGPFHLVRLFSRWVGLPPIAFANRRRAEQAAILLSSTDDAIAAIGAQVGWPDPSHFSRRFHLEFGTSPRSYRTQSRRRSGSDHQPTPDRNLVFHR